MYNLTFHAGGLTLRFNSNGNVDMEYDLKLWVWQGLVPELHDVGRFNGSLWIDSPKIRWHTSNNQVRRGWVYLACPRGSPRGRVQPGGGGRPCLPRACPAQQSPSPGLCAEARVPVLAAVPGGPGAPGQGVPLLLLRLRGLQGGQLPEEPR